MPTSSTGGTSTTMLQVPVFSFVLNNAKIMYNIISCLSSGKKDQHMMCDVDEDGLTCTIHSKAKSLQIKTCLHHELLDHFSVDESILTNENIRFRINLNTLLDCLSIFGPSTLHTTSVSMSYSLETAKLSLVLEEGGVLTECSIPTLMEEFESSSEVAGQAFELAFELAPVTAKVLIKSQVLRDAFMELAELPSAASVRLVMFPREDSNLDRESPSVGFRMSAAGETTLCEIDFLCSSGALVEFSCERESSATYHLGVIQSALKAVHVASESFIRMNEDGILSIQHMIETPASSNDSAKDNQSLTSDNTRGFVDVILSPEEDLSME